MGRETSKSKRSSLGASLFKMFGSSRGSSGAGHRTSSSEDLSPAKTGKKKSAGSFSSGRAAPPAAVPALGELGGLARVGSSGRGLSAALSQREVSVGGTMRFKSDVRHGAQPLTKLFVQSSGTSGKPRSIHDVYDTSASWELGRGGCGAVYTVRRPTYKTCAVPSAILLRPARPRILPSRL